nr:PREDICTED: uncharacterized protein LOC109632858 isoform X1 [Paralichthys olivaceus]XP_019947920.1 PREDICTED: uncharacterized protein LOC109632858 isoform X1 [Paralichthys olivaceus]
MDDLPVKHTCPFNQKPLDFYLKLLLLLRNVVHNQSFMQHCPIRSEDGGFPNFTSEAGSPFLLKLPLPATLGRMDHYELTLADGDSTLPHWMMFERQSNTLAGLALTEDCGIYRLKVSVTGEMCAECFYLHIRNKPMTDRDPARYILPCSEGEMMTWANLLLQLNPVTLNASQRLHLVSTMADYLHLPMGSVCLFTQDKPFMQRLKRLRVSGQSGFAEKADISGDTAELVWPVGCPGEEGQSDLATVLEHSVKMGALARLLGASVLEWRILCAPGGLWQRVKRDLQKIKFTPIPNLIVPTQVHQLVRLDNFGTYSRLLQLEPSVSTFLLNESHEWTKLEPKHTKNQTESAVNSLSKHAYTLPVSPENILKFRSEEQTFNTMIYRFNSDIHSEMPPLISKTNLVQKIQVPSTSLLSLKTFLNPYDKDGKTVRVQDVVPGRISLTTSHTHNSGVHTKQNASKIKPLVEATGYSEQPELTLDPSLSISEYLWTTDVFSSPFLPQHTSTVEHFVGEPSADTTLSTLVPSSTLHSVYPSLPLTPASYSVTPTLTHEAVDGVSRATRLTRRPHLKETSPQTESHRADRTDSERRPTVSSQGHIIFTHEPLKSHNTVEPTFQTLPSVSHPPQTEKQTDVLPPTSRSEPTQSAPSSNKIPSTLLLPDLSPTSYLTSEQLSITQQGETIQHLSPVSFGMSQDAVSQQNVTTRGESSTTSTGQLTPSGLTEVESWIRTSVFQPSAEMFTPALPSELFSAQLETPDTTNPVFSIEFVKASPSLISLLQTFSRSLLPDFDVSSLQENLKSKDVKDFQSKCTGEHIFFKSLTQISQITSVPLSESEDQLFEELSVKSDHKSLLFIPSMLQTLLHTLQFEESEHIAIPSHMFLIPGMTTSLYSTTTALTTITSGPSMTFPVLPSMSQSGGPVFQGHFDPTAPSAAQEPNTTPTVHEEDVLDCVTSYSRVVHKLWTTLEIDSQFFSTQTSVDNLSNSISLNLPPKVMQSIPVLVATVGFPFLYSIPPETFLDPDDGDADALSLEIRLIDGPPLSTGTWLALDGVELRGVPLEVDLHFAPQHLLLVARDRQGLSTSLRLTLDLLRSPIEPCHIFTLTARRSLHFILRHRHMVDVLLRKLSRFFNSSSSHHLSVVSMTPGSTVVSWYNRSLCEMRQIKKARCSFDRIHNMWLDMGSVDGSVNPDFREAMLPEFPVIKVGPVSYRQDCFPTTPPPTFNPAVNTTVKPDTNTPLSPTSNPCASASTPTSQESNSYPWMAGVFTALLVICLLILIVLLVATILYFCKGRGRSRTVAIWPANRLLSVQSRDPRAIRPRRPPLLQPELPPPPLRLWIDLTQDNERSLPGKQRPRTCDKALQPRPPYYDFSNT